MSTSLYVEFSWVFVRNVSLDLEMGFPVLSLDLLVLVV